VSAGSRPLAVAHERLVSGTVSSTPANSAAAQCSVMSYEISTDPLRLDVEAIHAFLTQSYWSAGIPKATVARAVEHSLCAGVYLGNDQVGFARVITDRASFGYLADVYILEAHRGRGLSKELVATLLAHPDLQGLRRLLLATRDAHNLYSKFGFKHLATPQRMMELHTPDVYRNG
jgi:GNAT superfamily N-acetyltransferase